jgi:hypothetical protein
LIHYIHVVNAQNVKHIKIRLYWLRHRGHITFHNIYYHWDQKLPSLLSSEAVKIILNSCYLTCYFVWVLNLVRSPKVRTGAGRKRKATRQELHGGRGGGEEKMGVTNSTLGNGWGLHKNFILKNWRTRLKTEVCVGG